LPTFSLPVRAAAESNRHIDNVQLQFAEQPQTVARR
jgi:hypothetical protein